MKPEHLWPRVIPRSTLRATAIPIPRPGCLTLVRKAGRKPAGSSNLYDATDLAGLVYRSAWRRDSNTRTPSSANGEAVRRRNNPTAVVAAVTSFGNTTTPGPRFTARRWTSFSSLPRLSTRCRRPTPPVCCPSTSARSFTCDGQRPAPKRSAARSEFQLYHHRTKRIPQRDRARRDRGARQVRGRRATGPSRHPCLPQGAPSCRHESDKSGDGAGRAQCLCRHRTSADLPPRPTGP